MSTGTLSSSPSKVTSASVPETAGSQTNLKIAIIVGVLGSFLLVFVALYIFLKTRRSVSDAAPKSPTLLTTPSRLAIHKTPLRVDRRSPVSSLISRPESMASSSSLGPLISKNSVRKANSPKPSLYYK